MKARPAAPSSEVVERAAALVGALRARAPRIHCITNGVAQAFTANVLLAAGAVPSMTTSPEARRGEAAGCWNAGSDCTVVAITVSSARAWRSGRAAG